MATAAPRKDHVEGHFEAPAYLRNIVLVERGQNVDIPGARGPLPPSEVADILRCTTDCPPSDAADCDDDDERYATEITKIVDVYKLRSGDPQEIVLGLPANANASVVHVFAPANHWSFEPGEPACAFPAHLDRPKIAAKKSKISNVIAVVDTGFVPTGNPNIDKFTQWDPNLDADVDGGGHGTFVASLIRQISPGTGVSIVRAQTVPHGEVTGRSIPPSASLTSEIHVYKALLRLIERHKGDENIAALNLSLGTYTVDVKNPLPLLAKAFAGWKRRFKGQIFAAAGNDDVTSRFYPAEMARVIGVEPLDVATISTAWDDTAQRVAPPKMRDPYNRIAPGVDLVGVRGAGDKNLVLWSGASFATPVFAAVTARDGMPPVKPLLYGDVKGLIYVDRRPSLHTT